MKICREFYFDAAHHLPDYKGKCEDVHGHTYKLEVVVKGRAGKNGMVLDFEKIKRIVSENIIEKLDHKDLNKIFKNPTAENIAQWIFNELKGRVNVSSVKLWEGRGKWVEVEERSA